VHRYFIPFQPVKTGESKAHNAKTEKKSPSPPCHQVCRELKAGNIVRGSGVSSDFVLVDDGGTIGSFGLDLDSQPTVSR